MYHVDVTLSPITAESLTSYRRKLESMAATRLRRVRRAIVVTATLAAGAGTAFAILPAGSALATFLAVFILGMLGFLIPTVAAFQAVTRGSVGCNPSAVPLAAMALAWLAGAAAWVHALAPNPDAVAALAVIVLAIMQASWTIGGGAGKRLTGPHLELARLQPIESARLHDLSRITQGAPGRYLAAVVEQGRMPVAMEYAALREATQRSVEGATTRGAGGRYPQAA